MALPPIVDSGISPEDMMPTEASVEVPVEEQVEMFPNGAEVIPARSSLMVRAVRLSKPSKR